MVKDTWVGWKYRLYRVGIGRRAEVSLGACGNQQESGKIARSPLTSPTLLPADMEDGIFTPYPPKLSRKRSLAMHRCTAGVIFILSAIFFALPGIHAAPKDSEAQSIIVEVEGDPWEHKEYLESYHPMIEVVEVYEQLFGGLALRGRPEKLEVLNELEFVTSLHQVRTYEAAPDQMSAVMAEPGEEGVLPSSLNDTSYTGKGIKVGVVDTGIDYNHPDLAANYRGGYDLVDLDDDPMETVAGEGIPTVHGTHVAGIIAADGVMKGVAPDAEIYAYRALGPGGRGTSIQVIAAMEQAVKDGVDIMNLSLGNTVNGPDYPTSMAVNRASELGVAVVLANGNNGPGDWTVGSPATASGALGVGASSPERKQPFLYHFPSDTTIPLAAMHGSVPWQLERAAQVVRGDGEALTGKIALFQRGEVPFYEMAKHAEEAGAAGVIIYNHEDGPLNGSVDGGNDPITIPVASIAREAGLWLEEQLQQGPVRLETNYMDMEKAVAEFSSRGPVTVNWDIKPDVIAPGTEIISTVPDGYQQLQGTSMAAPHVTGALALLKEAHPDWSNEQLFGALMTTALPLEEDGKPSEKATIQGMGEIRPKEAVEAETIIHDPMISLGTMAGYRESATKVLKVENHGSKPKTYTFDIPRKQRGLTWEFPTTVEVAPGESAELPVKLVVNSQQLEEGVHQGWITLMEEEQRIHLPYLFVNQQAGQPKVMGFELEPRMFEDDMYEYHLYLTEKAVLAEVDLYDPDTLMYERNLLRVEEPETGQNEGKLTGEDLGPPGYYIAVITAYLENGEQESVELLLHLE
ncbi:S8 family serine peptidase [Virgibacillus sediminis]|uniref:S8 family serine peptidase n=1 Tax=Virgibacillus sediminis TaxID=202260 RepID=A0ABV7A796_9BACI